LAFLLPAILLALLPSFANAAIVHEQTLTNDSADLFVSSLQVASVASGTDQLYVAAISIYGNASGVAVNTITGGSGLTWTLQKRQCSRRLNRAYIEVWQAFGSPGASFNVDITLTGGTAVTTAAVSRYSGADSTTPTEGADGSNTGGLGINAVCDGLDEETANLSLSLTSSNNDSVLFVASHPRNTVNAEGGSGAFLYVHDRTLATAGTDSADHTIGSVTGWDMAGLVINPAGAGGGACPIDKFIAVASDDAEESVSSGSVNLTSSDLELIADGGDQLVGLRFTSIDIDQGATITNAYVEFTAQEAPKANAAELYFKAQDIDTAPTFTTTTSDISNRTTTTASVTWASVAPWDTNGAQYQSPDISSVIQEIVDRPGWTNNNAIAIVITGTTGSHRVADAHGTGTNVKLHVECSAGATPAVTSAVAEISPNDVTTSSTGNSFTYDVQATIGGGDTGVNRVTITVPGTFGAPTVTAVQDDGVGVAFTDNTVGNAISVDLTTKITASSKITVLFNANAPTTADATGVDFTSTVDDSGTGDAAQATTEGNGDGDAGDANSWTVTTTDSIGGSGGGACPAPGAGGWYPGGWQYRKPLSIGAGNVGSNLTDFPVLVSLASDTDLAADAQADFDDILFTAADGTTKLSHEIEKYNETTGELVAWVKVPTVSSSADTVFYMYYGNASATNQQDPTGVWSNGYAGVWHLKEDPSGTAPQMNDSTLNAIHGTSVGSMTSGNQIGGKIAASFQNALLLRTAETGR
jgi:hypothetical protein